MRLVRNWWGRRSSIITPGDANHDKNRKKFVHVITLIWQNLSVRR
nr:MAG TPA: hypothetical protein [Caudoviricetes sp.]